MTGQEIQNVQRTTVYFHMVLHPFNGWTRVGKAYASRKCAKTWTKVVRGYWRGLHTKIEECTLEWREGKLTPESVVLLSMRYNMDPPENTNKP